jgi:hypothetical protein
MVQEKYYLPVGYRRGRATACGGETSLSVQRVRELFTSAKIILSSERVFTKTNIKKRRPAH